MKTFLAFLSLVFICGCSANKSLAQKLKEADRIVVINPRDGLSIAVTGEEVDRIVKAIASGKSEPLTIEASPGLTLQFFKAAKHLTNISISVTVFWVGQKPYSDKTGTLQALVEKFREENPPKFSP